MKKVLLSSAILFCLLGSLLSCSKQSQDNYTTPDQPEKFITATVSPGQTYIYTAGLSGILAISRQASHFQLSEALTDSKNGAVLYKYVPEEGYQGADEVSLKYTTTTTMTNYGSCSGNHTSTVTTNNLITIKLQVAN